MRKTAFKIIKNILIISVSIFVLYLAKCSYEIYDALRPENMCGKTLGIEVLSPDGQYKAVVYEFNCGAMDPFSTQVSILNSKDEIPFSRGNIFSSSRGERRGLWNGPYVEIEWLSNIELHIKHIKDTDVHQKNIKYQDIEITYEKL